jgi:hypothetical protein
VRPSDAPSNLRLQLAGARQVRNTSTCAPAHDPEPRRLPVRHSAARPQLKRVALGATVVIGCRRGTSGLGVLAGTALVVIGTGCDICSDRLVAIHPSPSGQVSAAVFERNCGATTDFATQVSLVESATPERNPDPVLILDGPYNQPFPRGPGGGPSVHVRWLRADSLELSFDPRIRAFRKITSRRGVDITYREATEQVAPN